MISSFLILPILFTTPSNVPSTTFTLNDTNIINIGLIREYNSTTTVEQPTSTTAPVSNNIALCESLYTTYIPQNIRTYLEQQGWTYQLVTKETLVELAGTNNIIGYTDIKNKIVYVEDDVLSIKRAFLHEYGHAVGTSITKGMIEEMYANGIDPMYLDFNAIYEEEKTFFTYTYKGNDLHEISNLAEYLASTFHEYITNPYNLNDNCPKTYVFWTNIINNF